MEKIVIMGAGESGMGAAELAASQNLQVWLSEKGAIAAQDLEQLRKKKVPFEQGGHSEKKFYEADVVVKSPGIPGDLPLLKAVREKGIPVISEIEFASRFTDSRIFAITGTNGKTTTATLVWHLLKGAGLEVGLAGNIGQSFARMVSMDPHPCYVLEVSSFQLDDIETFRPEVALLLNITPDHLDRYEGSMERYAAAKFRIGMNQQGDDRFVFNLDDQVTTAEMPRHKLEGQLQGFAASRKKAAKGWIEDQELVFATGRRVNFTQSRLIGQHNMLNALAAILAVRPELPHIEESLASFRPIEHRLEWVAEIEGVLYINDSKATNTDAVRFALDGMDRPVVWLVGGIDKGNDYRELVPIAAEKVKALVVIGPHKEKFFQSFDLPRWQVNTMESAVEMAASLAREGDCVLLSPACASFDLFRNYEDRGRQFKAAVGRLKSRSGEGSSPASQKKNDQNGSTQKTAS